LLTPRVPRAFQWVALIYAGFTLVLIVTLLPETYAPVLLTRRAQKIRKADPTAEVYAAFELEEKDIKQVVTRVLTRPIRMILTELIVTATCLYLALVYAVSKRISFVLIIPGGLAVTP